MVYASIMPSVITGKYHSVGCMENLCVVNASIMPSVITGKYHSVGCMENLCVVDASIMPSVITGKYHSVGCMGWRTYMWSMPLSCLLSSLVSTTV